MEASTKALYKAVTTKKRYVIDDDEYIRATNNLPKINSSSVVLDAEDIENNLKALRSSFHNMNQTWTKYCYHYTFEHFLWMYELTEYQYKQIKRILG